MDNVQKVNNSFITSKHAALMLGITPLTLNRWVKRGLAPNYYIFNGIRRFTIEDIKSFIEKSRSVR